MALLKSLYRTSLSASKKDKLLAKIKRLASGKSSRFTLDRGSKRFKGNEVTSLVINDAAPTGTVQFDAGSRYGTSAASLVEQDLTYTAKQVDGFYRNDVTIEYVDGGTAGAEVVTLKEDDLISVLMESGVSDADEIKAAIEGNAQANALVGIVVSGTGTNAQTATGPTALTGGGSTQSYDKADILDIKRLRTKKWAIKVKPDADPS